MVNNRKYKIVLWSGVVFMTMAATMSFTVGYKRYISKYGKNTKINSKEHANTQNRKDGLAETSINSVSKKQEKILNTTKYKEIFIDLNKDTTSIQEINMPSYYVGLDREQLEKYCEYHMNNRTADELKKGLKSIQVVEFSKKQVTVQKEYDSSNIEYFVKNDNGYVCVYYADKKTLYENTNIPVKDVPSGERAVLDKGFMVANEDELMGILESYSS